MHFTGTVFFNFDSFDVWRIHTMLLKASRDRNVTVDVDWRAFTDQDPQDGSEAIRALAACEAVRVSSPQQHDRFVRAMLTLAYQERDNPGAPRSLAVAARVAGIEAGEVLAAIDEPGIRLLTANIDSARERGVAGVPSIERQGPPVLIHTTGAANYGDAVSHLQLIDHMIRDDGIWVMSKPA